MDPLAASLSILSAMITPAILISACGTLILSTSNRLTRLVERTRAWSEQYEALVGAAADDAIATQKRAMVFAQLVETIRRVRLLQQGLTVYYLAVNVFIATSIAIGLVALTGAGLAWLPVALGLGGAALLLYGSALLIAEGRFALATTYRETEFLLMLSRHHAPETPPRRRQPRWPSRGRPRAETEP